MMGMVTIARAGVRESSVVESRIFRAYQVIASLSGSSPHST